MRHTVHCYAVVRVPIEVEADDHQAAMAQAAEQLVPTLDRCLRWPAEYADEIAYFMVDEANDPEFDRSLWYDNQQRPGLPDGKTRGEASEALLVTVAAMKLEDEVEGGIENDEAWEDRQSLIRQAREIVGDPGYPEVNDETPDLDQRSCAEPDGLRLPA